MHLHRLWSPRRARALVGITLVSLTFACAPAPTAVPTAVPADPFVVVRATSQAAYDSGKAHLDRGELAQALIDFDRAKTNDPDARADIEQALSQTISQLATQTPTPEPPPPTSSTLPRAIVVATIPAARPVSAATAGLRPPAPSAAQGAPTPAAAGAPTLAIAGAPTPAAVGAATPTTGTGPTTAAAGRPTPARASTEAATGAATSLPQGTPGAAAQGSGSAALVAFHDPQGRFSVSAPDSWARAGRPLSLVGTSVVQFNDPSAQAELDVAVDSTSRAVSPELYAATMELAMQQQVPGYAAEGTQPGSTSGSPSVRRNYTFTQRDAAGNDTQTRGFQVTVVKGATPYLISASAPAEKFDAFSATFDQMLDTFRLS